MNSKVLLGIGAALLLGGLAFLALRSHEKLVSNLPPVEQPMPQIVAVTEALDFAKAHPGYKVTAVLGTGSMAPYIPASPEGKDPMKTVMAYAVVGGDFKDVHTGTLCVYAPEGLDYQIIHLAVSFVNGGWIMTGLANKHYETWWRMTPKEFRGYAIKVFLVQQ